MKSYTLKTSGRGEIAAAFAKVCLPGQPGERLIRSGLTQGSFCLFLAELASLHFAAKREPKVIAQVLAKVSGGNASAAKQALETLVIKWEDGKEESVATHWGKSGEAAAPDLSILDLA